MALTGISARNLASTGQMTGPRKTPLLGWNVEVLRWSRDPVGYLNNLYNRYGTFSVWNANRPLRVFAFLPEHNQRLLSNPDLFRITRQSKRGAISPGSAMMNLRSGLLSLDDQEHRHHRRLINPAFHARRVEGYAVVISDMTDRMLSAWLVGEIRDIESDLRRLTHRIAMKVVLSLEDERELVELNDLIEELLAVTPRAMMFPLDLPGSSYRRMMAAADRITAFLQLLVERKRGDSAAYQDVLTMLMNARDETGMGFKSAELIAEAYNVLCHETSASSLVWTLFLLAQHPRIYGDLLDELEGEMGGAVPDIESLSRMPLLERVIKESLRLIPTAPFGTRFSTQACQFGPVELPAGAAVTFSQYITHRLPEIYPEPLRFLPRRWEGQKPGPYEYFPFGTGVHNCVGASFAMLEMKIVLAMTLQRYSISVAPNVRIDRAFRLSLRPRNGLPILVSRRGRPLSKTPVSGNIHETVDLN